MPNKDILDLPFPPVWVNAYIQQELNKYGFSVLTIPSNATAIDDLSKNRIDIPTQYDDEGIALAQQPDVVIQYDRLFRFRRSGFYPLKCEQLLYYVYSTPSKILDVSTILSQLLDRSDAAAEDLNKWAMVKQNGENPLTDLAVPLTRNVYFHDMKVYQLEEVRDLTELSALRGLTLNKFIIEYDYHVINQPKILNTNITDPDHSYT
jgi:hypothetical protein